MEYRHTLSRSQQTAEVLLINSRLWYWPAAGFAIAFSLTLFVTVWEWIENPGGIFRGDAGTNWTFVWETAWSWLFPSTLQLVPLFLFFGFVWNLFATWRNRQSSEEKSG